MNTSDTTSVRSLRHGADRRFLITGALALAILMVSAIPGRSHDYKVGDLVIGHPWTRATAPSAKVGAGYLTIRNDGREPDRLLAATFAGAGSVEVHEMAMDGNVMRMRELKDGIEIRPGQTLELKPGGFHLMFMGLTAGLKEGASLKGELVFARAGRIAVEFKVEGIGAKGGGHEHHHHAPRTN